MTRRLFLAALYLFAISSAALPGLAQIDGVRDQGFPGPRPGVLPTITYPHTAAASAALQRIQEREQPRPGLEVPEGAMEGMKSRALQATLTHGKEIHFDSGAGRGPLAPGLGTNFTGLGQNGWIPYDAAIAVGPNHIVVMTNSQWAVYDRAGVQLSLNSFGSWWGTQAGTPFDPKCFYDAAGGRFVMLAVSKNASLAFYHISVSQTSDPTGAWFTYKLDARVDGTTQTTNWADFPGLGYHDNAIFLTSNQFSLCCNAFQHAKLRAFDKAVLYAGSPATFTDFVNMTNSSGSKAFTLQPARALTSSAAEYLLNTVSGGSNFATLWRVDNAPSAPTLTRQATLSIGAYSVPPDAPQPGTTTLVATNDSRMYDIVFNNGELHGTFGEAFSGVAAIRYLRVDTATSAVLKDITFTNTAIHYYFPAVTVDAANNLYFVFSRSSSSEYASVYQTGMTPSDTTIQPSALVKAGVATNTSGRWGDYSGIANDPADNLAVWIYGGWANTSNQWATWIANTSFSIAAAPPVPTLTSISPTKGIQGQNVNLTLTGTDFIAGDTTVNVSMAGVTPTGVNVTSSTQATATLAIAANAATRGDYNISVTTAGGTSNTRAFGVYGIPTISSISPANGNRGTSFTVTLTGTQFFGSSPTVSGTGITLTNAATNGPLFTMLSYTMTIAAGAATGPRTITLSNPAGTSNAVTFTVNAATSAPTLSSVSPSSGTQGTSVNVTLTGTNFLAGATVAVSGTGVTLSNVVVVNSTQITATFTIASSAATGARSVTVTTSSGTSNAVNFTVNAPPVPTLTSISPTKGIQGQNVNLTLAGTGFIAGNTTVNVSMSGVTPTSVNVTSSTQATATLAIAANAATRGDYNISVTTAGGTSNTRAFGVYGIPTISSISPANGNRGTSFTVTLTGTQFFGSSPTVSGTGITLTNAATNGPLFTMLSYTMTIAAGAATGPRTITLSNPAGTSNAVTFTVQ